MTERTDGQVTWSDLGIWSGKTCQEHSAATKGKTSRQSSKRSYASQSRKPPILKCLKKAGTPGGATTMKWEDDGAWLGECMTRNTGESPNVAVESRLSQILEETPQGKYRLSAKACQGIRHRAERRGKKLPEVLERVLTAAAGMSGNNQPVICAAFKAGQGAKANGIGYAEECAPTLGAVSSGLNQCPSVLVFDRAQITSPDNRSTIGPDKPCPALHTFGEVPAVCYQMQGFGDYREGDVASSCKQRDFKDGTDLAITSMVVRRLTPMECERLQGFPDHWTDIGEWRDSKGKLRKDADSPRYKALGNSIALPFWDFLAKRISAQYLRPVTMGSLFDGIGGFPLVFERHNGKGTARWASEIEEFPIAVTKLRFGEG